MPKERKDWIKVKLRKGKCVLNDGRKRNAPEKLSVRFNRAEYIFEGDLEVEILRAEFEGDNFNSARGYLEISAETVIVPDKPKKEKRDFFDELSELKDSKKK